MADDSKKVDLVFADKGSFHTLTVSLPAASLEGHDRILDVLQEDPEVTRKLFVDPKRLVSATVVE